MASYSSVSSNITTNQTNISNKKNDYINIKNAVKILTDYSNWNGYIKLYTEVESNFEVGDIVYITYTSGTTATNTFNLENPATPYADWYMGYEVLYVNNSKNELVINRDYNDITAGYILDQQYLSRVSVRGGSFYNGVIDGLVFYKTDIFSGVSFTQGIFKSCHISDVYFDDKYKTVKTLYTTNKFSSKFTSKKSKTATVYKNKRYYYNQIDRSYLYDCDIDNGQFDNSHFYGSGNTINDGIFDNCIISGYTINNGNFKNCVIDENCTWNYGIWSSVRGTIDFRTDWLDGVWNSGSFIDKTWSGGTFNAGIFSGTTFGDAIWIDGIVNNGNFYNTIWYNGLVRYGNFYNSTWSGGTFNDGNFVDSIWSGGTFNNGTFEKESLFANGYIKGGTFTGSTISDGRVFGGTIYDCTINDAKFYSNYNIDNCTITDAMIHSGTISNSNIMSGNYYNGVYDNVDFKSPIFPATTLIHNGQYTDCELNDITIRNGIFNTCVADGVNWKYGIFTDGTFKNGVWNNGIWNDSIFDSTLWLDGQFYGGYFSGGTESPPTDNWTATWSGGTFHYGYFKGVYRTSLPVQPYSRINYSQTSNTHYS
jgi:uncharacterized protein YjbI with pentapeptide repeats